MTIVTIFLVILVVALALGNLLLHLTKPEKRLMQTVSLPSEEKMLVDSKMKAMNELTNMAHQRLNALESFLKQNVVNGKGKAKPGTALEVKQLEEKVRKLDNFRANTEIEMQAIKEIALVMKENLNQPKTAKSTVKPVKMIKRKRKPMAA